MKSIIPKLIGGVINLMVWIVPSFTIRKAFQLFCYPRRPRLKEHQLAFLKSAEQISFSLGNETVRAYRWGNGPQTVLFLHGWQSHSFRWKNYIAALDPSMYSVYAIDAPGHGQSTGSQLTVPLYADAIDKLMKITGPVDAVVSHSIGSFSALYTFFRNPGTTPGRLVLLAPPGGAADFIRFFSATLGLTAKSESLLVAYFRKVVQADPEWFSSVRFAAVMTCAGLIIHDEDDQDTAVQNSVLVSEQWPQAKLIITKGEGHNLKSQDVIKSVIDFITSGKRKHRFGQQQSEVRTKVPE